VQGNLLDFVLNISIKILGVSFTVDNNGVSGETEFENTSDIGIT
jgi:hypothetical protein